MFLRLRREDVLQLLSILISTPVSLFFAADLDWGTVKSCLNRLYVRDLRKWQSGFPHIYHLQACRFNQSTEKVYKEYTEPEDDTRLISCPIANVRDSL